MSGPDRAQTALFRRRRFEAPHRRRHPLSRLARPLAGALAVVGLPAAAAWWVVTSPAFQIRQIQVESGRRVPPSWVGERLAALRGRHLLAVGLAEVGERLAGHPWIAGLVVRRDLPGRLTVAVVEKRPAALWSDDGRLFVLDRDGRRIAPLEADGAALDLPVLAAAPGAPADRAAAAAAIRLAASWERLRPEDRVSQVEILRSGDFRLVTSSLPFTLVVSAERLESAPGALARALPVIARHPAAAAPGASVDLRFSRQIVFQPAARPPREEG